MQRSRFECLSVLVRDGSITASHCPARTSQHSPAGRGVPSSRLSTHTEEADVGSFPPPGWQPHETRASTSTPRPHPGDSRSPQTAASPVSHVCFPGIRAASGPIPKESLLLGACKGRSRVTVTVLTEHRQPGEPRSRPPGMRRDPASRGINSGVWSLPVARWAASRTRHRDHTQADESLWPEADPAEPATPSGPRVFLESLQSFRL